MINLYELESSVRTGPKGGRGLTGPRPSRATAAPEEAAGSSIVKLRRSAGSLLLGLGLRLSQGAERQWSAGSQGCVCVPLNRCTTNS